MESIAYEGEHSWPGVIGNIFVILAFLLAVLAAISFYFAAKERDDSASWQKLARVAFRLHSLSIVGIVVTLFIMLANHYYEYHYVWKHSSNIMPMRYILSCFWEGQEGSFLLWTFWHAVLGNILLFTAKKWEAPVMSVFSLVQAFLGTMLLGIFIFEQRIGSNPFTVLLREHPDFVNLPLFQDPHYLQNLDGRGLNPLLQNYWMTIHPPTLFLGFASTLVPFCYAIAGLWKQRFQEWLRPAMPWAFFGVMVLGTGILMGGAWAYEALSFGGFWAWDPVENASLVPWLTLVGAAHLMMIHKNKGSSLVWVLVLTMLTFILVLYSTFLVRSGILGDTSVHAFTDDGMTLQLVAYLLTFVTLSIWLMVKNFKKLPGEGAEDHTWSRELWMFIGSLVLFISAFQIISTTSIPVFNPIARLFLDRDLTTPTDPIAHYNRWQVILATIVAFIMGFGQYLKYKKTDRKTFFHKIKLPIAVAVAITILVIIMADYRNPFYVALFFASTFAILANLNYLIRVLKGRIKNAGGSLAHVGFGMILLGALISTSAQEHISKSTFDLTALGDNMDNQKSILLPKNDTLSLGDYHVAYRGRVKEGIFVRFQVDYMNKLENDEYEHAFTLFPFVQLNQQMGNVGEPDTRHFLEKDIYTHVTWAKLEDDPEPVEEYGDPVEYIISIGDTVYPKGAIVVLNNIVRQPDKERYNLGENDIAVGASLSIFDLKNRTSYATPLFVIRGSAVHSLPAILEEQGLRIDFNHINPETGKITLSIASSNKEQDFIVMEAIVFPFINILWAGCILLIIGTVVAIRNRALQSLKR